MVDTAKAEPKKLQKGILIAIEGIDGVGKTTQSLCLYNKLQREGYPVSLFHEPTDGKWGKKILQLAKAGRRKINANTECELFFLDRVEDVKKNIGPALNRNEIVIMDRYYLSNIAYQGARGLDPDEIEKKNLEIAPRPTLTIILDASPRVTLARIKNYRSIKPNFERERYLNKVRQIFKGRFSGLPDVEIIDGGRSIDEISLHIYNIIKPIIDNMLVSEDPHRPHG